MNPNKGTAEKLREINEKRPYALPGLALLATMSLLHVLMPVIKDDIWFGNVREDFGLIEFLLMRYEIWSSRVIVEGVMWVLVHNWWLWVVLNISVWCSLWYFLARLFSDKPDDKTYWVVASLIFVFPFFLTGSAGYMATSLNFVWPLAFGVVAGYGMKKSMRGEKIRIWEYFLYFLALLYASNIEQMNIILLVIIAILLGYDLYTKKQVNYVLLSFLALVILMLVFILSTPGNDARYYYEIEAWFPEFPMFSIIHRFAFGYSFTLSNFIFHANLIFTVFCVALYMAVHFQYESKVHRAIAFIPMGSSVLVAMAQIIASGREITIINQFGRNLPSIVYGTSFNLHFYLFAMYLGFIILCILASLYFCFKSKPEIGGLCISLLLLGLGSGLIMGFSPTIWASGFRTLIFAYFSMIACTIVIYQKIREIQPKAEPPLRIGVCALGAISYMGYFVFSALRLIID